MAGVTPLGMIELTRQRIGLSLTEALCDASGALSSASIAYRLLRDATRFALTSKAAGVRVFAAPDVIAALQEPLSGALREAGDIVKGGIILVPCANYPRVRVEFAPA